VKVREYRERASQNPNWSRDALAPARQCCQAKYSRSSGGWIPSLRISLTQPIYFLRVGDMHCLNSAVRTEWGPANSCCCMGRLDSRSSDVAPRDEKRPAARNQIDPANAAGQRTTNVASRVTWDQSCCWRGHEGNERIQAGSGPVAIVRFDGDPPAEYYLQRLDANGFRDGCRVYRD
jgi:hypothetical protein